MTDRLDPINVPHADERKVEAEKRYQHQGRLVIPPGMRFWSIDNRTGEIEEVQVQREVGVSMSGKKAMASLATIDRVNYRYCVALNYKNAKRHFDNQAKRHGIQ